VSAAPPGGVVVVDTDVVSFIFKGDTRGVLYRPHVDGQIAVIAAQTRAELELWTLERNWGPRRKGQLRQELRKYVLAPFTEAVCLRWAQILDDARRTGRPVSTADAWVAATALAYAVPLVTHNSGDFAGIPGLIVIAEKKP
jgi:predicted nucleic acid-binding protein